MNDPHIVIKTDKETNQSQIIAQGSEDRMKDVAFEKAKNEGGSFARNPETGDCKTVTSTYEVFDKNDFGQ